MRNTVKTCLTVAILILITGCTSPKLAPLNKGDIIVAFGDSLTQGVGVERKDSYPSVLSALSGYTVINAGISGETTAEGLKRLPDVIAEHSPSLVILLEGGNDILRNKSITAMKQNLDSMIQFLQQRNIQVVLIGVPEKNLFSSSAPLYEELAEKYDLVLDDSLISSLMRNPSKKSDAVHFNREGYNEMAHSIYELLDENGAFN